MARFIQEAKLQPQEKQHILTWQSAVTDSFLRSSSSSSVSRQPIDWTRSPSPWSKACGSSGSGAASTDKQTLKLWLTLTFLYVYLLELIAINIFFWSIIFAPMFEIHMSYKHLCNGNGLWAFPRGVNQTYCSPWMKCCEKTWGRTDWLWKKRKK